MSKEGIVLFCQMITMMRKVDKTVLPVILDPHLLDSHKHRESTHPKA